MSQFLIMYLGVFSSPYFLFHSKVRLVFVSFTLLKDLKMVMLLFQHRKNFALNLRVDWFCYMLFYYGITYIKVSQHSPAVWKFRYFMSNGKTQNSKVKVSGAFSSIDLLNVTRTFLICNVFSCTLVCSSSYSDKFFLYSFFIFPILFFNLYTYC